MIETTIEDPEKLETVRTDDQGRASLGVEFADHEVEVLVVSAEPVQPEEAGFQQTIGERPMSDHERKGMLFVRTFGIDPTCLVADHGAVTGPDGVEAGSVGLSDVDWSDGVLLDERNVARFRFEGTDGDRQFPFSDEPTAEPVGVTADDDSFDTPVFVFENEAGETTAIAQELVENVRQVYDYDPTEELSHVRVHPEEGPYPVLFGDPGGDTHVTIAPWVAD